MTQDSNPPLKEAMTQDSNMPPSGVADDGTTNYADRLKQLMQINAQMFEGTIHVLSRQNTALHQRVAELTALHQQVAELVRAEAAQHCSDLAHVRRVARQLFRASEATSDFDMRAGREYWHSLAREAIRLGAVVTAEDPSVEPL